MNRRESGPPRAASRILFFIVLIDLVGFGIVLPLLPGQAAKWSSSETAIGILVASFSLMQFVVAPWWGRLSDRIGRRPVLLLGLASSTASYLLFALAESYWVLLLSRVLAGGLGATVNVAQAYLADITAPEQRSRAMGSIGVAFGLGFIIGPAIAALTSGTGAVVPGLTATACCFLSLILGWKFLPETRVHRPASPGGPIPWSLVSAPYLTMLFSVVGFAVITVVFPLFTMEVLRVGRRETSMFFVLMGISSALVQAWLIGRLAPRWGERRLMLLGCLLLAAGLATIPLASAPEITPFNSIVFIVALIALSAGTGFAWPAIAGYISRNAEEQDQGRALGALHSVASVARVIGPVLAGVAGEQAGFHQAFLIGAGLALMAAVTAILSRTTVRG